MRAGAGATWTLTSSVQRGQFAVLERAAEPNADARNCLAAENANFMAA